MATNTATDPVPRDEALAALHAAIYRELETEQKTNPMSYMKFANAKGRPYQTYERIGFEGLRWSRCV